MVTQSVYAWFYGVISSIYKYIIYQAILVGKYTVPIRL